MKVFKVMYGRYLEKLETMLADAIKWEHKRSGFREFALMEHSRMAGAADYLLFAQKINTEKYKELCDQIWNAYMSVCDRFEEVTG